MNADADLSTAHALFDGGRLTLAREYARLRKVELARMLDVTPAAITQYEQGKTRPGRATLAAISLQLGLPHAFFVPSGHPNTVSEACTPGVSSHGVPAEVGAGAEAGPGAGAGGPGRGALVQG